MMGDNQGCFFPSKQQANLCHTLMLKLNIIATQEELCKRNKNLHQTKKNITTKEGCRL